jgi:hypothetical protein
MSIFSAVKAFIATYDGLEDGAPLSSDYQGSEPTWYAIVPQAGPEILEKYINGKTVRQFPFAFQSTMLA